MAYLGNQPTTGDNDSFRILDDISSHTRQFDGSSTAIVSTSDNTITLSNHRFVTGRSKLSTTGGSIGGLASGTNYFIIKNDKINQVATNASNAANNVAITLSSVGTGTDHNIIVAADGVNAKFKATYDGGGFAGVTRAAQLTISINGVIQQPQSTSTPSTGYGLEGGDVIVFASTSIYRYDMDKQ